MLTWAKLGSVCLVSGLLLAAAAALAPASSTFFLIDASACIALAVAFYVVALWVGEAPQPQPALRRAKSGWGVNVVLALVVLSASTPLVKTGIETAARGATGAPIINKVTCPLSVPDAKPRPHPARQPPSRPRG